MSTTPQKVRMSRSVLGEEEKRAVMAVLDDGYLGMGSFVKDFEADLTAYLGRPATCVATGTAAVQLGVQGVGCGPGDDVLAPSLTFVATFQAIRATGARAIPCEVVPGTLTLDVDDLRKRLTPATKAIVPVHYASGVGDLDAIYDFAKEKGLRVVEDAAHAFGGTHHGKLVGSFGDVACFSFDGIKNITCGEGGAVFSADPKVVQAVADARLLGVEKDTDRRFAGERSWEFDVSAPGWRYHMPNISAAIGREQLRKLPEFVKVRRALSKRYVANLTGVPGLELLRHDWDAVAPHIFVVRVLDGRRDELRSHLLANGVECGIHYKPNHLLTLFSENPSGRPFPVTERVYGEILTLPLQAALTEGEVDRVSGLVTAMLGAPAPAAR